MTVPLQDMVLLHHDGGLDDVPVQDMVLVPHDGGLEDVAASVALLEEGLVQHHV